MRLFKENERRKRDFLKKIDGMLIYPLRKEVILKFLSLPHRYCRSPAYIKPVLGTCGATSYQKKMCGATWPNLHPLNQR